MKNLYTRLEQSWNFLLKRWDCEHGHNYGAKYVLPMKDILNEFEKEENQLVEAAMVLDQMLKNFEKQEGV